MLERVHQVRRRELYEPENVQLPAKWTSICGDRYTEMLYTDGTNEECGDNWQDKKEPYLPNGEWTGMASFVLEP